ncbi:SDR family NAD(P)-dependent oxidoreductase [Neorhizobium galegae]|uniref:SDR family NAD(P)-dependent oxidoreductase n=1 Tax=Neorhizobium galegae TaxID=399 RepID=UPI0009B9E441|nr:SDR family oxidoreductase [Neorhizobium galegae]KAB1120481.1 SDR family oxidoreductase [Neorhizobium galegae]MCQ1575239.1 SDR family oxidoreductase [Neorhizobium galegae]MCQ1809079.1 SDR family oxidoreductase [Neorhizobium galegae]MCQ1839270.1 SDR family oxidoreductase [Neorhizobium galegae]
MPDDSGSGDVAFRKDRRTCQQCRRDSAAPAENLEASNIGDFDAIFRVNVAGTHQMIRAAAPHLRQAALGAIVNVSSDSALSGSGSSLAYAASKGALSTMTRGLARTLSPAIRVNAVCPGFVDTTWALAWHDEASYRAFVP